MCHLRSSLGPVLPDRETPCARPRRDLCPMAARLGNYRHLRSLSKLRERHRKMITTSVTIHLLPARQIDPASLLGVFPSICSHSVSRHHLHNHQLQLSQSLPRCRLNSITPRSMPALPTSYRDVLEALTSPAPLPVYTTPHLPSSHRRTPPQQ